MASSEHGVHGVGRRGGRSGRRHRRALVEHGRPRGRGERADPPDPADGRARPRRVPRPSVARQHLPPLLLPQAAPQRGRAGALHHRRLRRSGGAGGGALRRVHRLGQLRALARTRRRRRRLPGRRRPPGEGDRHPSPRASGRGRPQQWHRPLHRRGARRQPADARRLRPRRLAGGTALPERRRRPRLLARGHRGVPRLGRAPRAARRLARRRPPALAARRSPSSAPATSPARSATSCG